MFQDGRKIQLEGSYFQHTTPAVTRRKQQKMGHSSLKDVFNKSSFWFWKSLE
jgi:hypothetical protein